LSYIWDDLMKNYVFQTNIYLGIVEITVSGIWSEEEFARFESDLTKAIVSYPSSKPPMSLYNYTNASIQTQSVVAKMQDLARAVSPDRSVALYTEGSLARLQAKRIASVAPNMEVFETRQGALGWLAQRRSQC
jgi:hypothetical protein